MRPFTVSAAFDLGLEFGRSASALPSAGIGVGVSFGKTTGTASTAGKQSIVKLAVLANIDGIPFRGRICQNGG